MELLTCVTGSLWGGGKEAPIPGARSTHCPVVTTINVSKTLQNVPHGAKWVPVENRCLINPHLPHETGLEGRDGIRLSAHVCLCRACCQGGPGETTARGVSKPQWRRQAENRELAAEAMVWVVPRGSTPQGSRGQM